MTAMANQATGPLHDKDKSEAVDPVGTQLR
jgi:hypothetical protein